MNNINKKNLSFIFMLLSIILIIVYIVEYKLGHKPCKLCIYQRVPYFVALFLLFKLLVSKGYEKLTLFILFLIFVFSSILAFYHFGIEQGFFVESLVCSNQNSLDALSKKELLEQLKQEKVNCKDVNFTLLGLSLSTINMIFSTLLSLIFLRFFLKYKQDFIN